MAVPATTFAWDSLDRLKSVTSPSGLVTNYAYADSTNGWTRRTTARVASGVTKAESHLWDRDGLLRAFVDGKGTSALYSYDSLARMTGIVYKNANGTAAGSPKVFRYTADGWTRATVFGTVSDSLTYDALGRNLKSIQKIGTATYTVEHRYDDKNRLDSLVHPDGSVVVRRFDVRGRMISLRRNGVRLDTLVWQGARRASATLGNGIAATYGYDAIGRMTTLKYAKGTTSLLDFSFAYTTAGKLLSQYRTHASQLTEAYGWTPDGQLASMNRGGSAYQTWSAEATGNGATVTTSGVAQSRTYNGFGELTGVGTSTLTYDLSGNLTSDGTRNLFWTPDGRLDSVGGKQKFLYDALGRLVRRTLVTGESTDMVYDGWREIQSSSSAGEKVIRVWGEYLDEEVVEFRTKSGVTTTRYLLAGNNWNTEAQTDESGNITRIYLVDPFGTFKVYTGAGVDGKWFTTDDVAGDPATLEGERVLQGLPWYGSTGLYHLRNRWYSPTLQRFLSMDPLGFDAGDANLYRFEGNDPLGNLDPMGAAVSARDGGIAIAEGYFTGLLFRFLAARAPNFVASTGPLGVAAGVLALAKVLETSTEIYAGKESGTMRKLCPQEIEDRKDMLKLFALGIGGGVGSARGGKFLDRIVPKKNSVNEGAEVLAKEAEAGLVSRAGDGAPDGRSYAKSVTEGGSGNAFAGHGEYRHGSGTVTVPEGTSVTVWGEHGKAILDDLGGLVEQGAYDRIASTPGLNTTGARTYLPGAEMPNYTLKAPTGLDIFRNSMTVENSTPLSQLLKSNMGHIDWAACLLYR
ncbi:MAG: RHS repeat protein [Fibrobacteres bacterium]|nr:RHS repeat protein [Fibrobacterota bacterium]